MAGTIKLPFLGDVKTGWAIAGGGAVVIITGIAWYRHRQSAAAAGSTTTGSATTAPIDPATGYPEGSPQDTAALAQQEAADSGAYETSSPVSNELYYDPLDGQYDLTEPYTGTTTTAAANDGPGTFTDNAYWVQYAIENVQGYTADQVQGALAAYLAGMALTSTQMSIYQAAIAVAGPAPQPPATAAHLANNGGAATGTAATVTVPNITGDDVVNGSSACQAAGLVMRPEPAAVPGKTHVITSQSPKAGSQAARGSTVTITYKTT